MPRLAAAALSLLTGCFLLPACSEGADTPSPTDTAIDSLEVGDTSAPDVGTDASDANADVDAARFACGATTCDRATQFCKLAGGPGICPVPDSGICPAGCPGCPSLPPPSCVALPPACASAPTCACLGPAVCGPFAGSTCDESKGGPVLGCLSA